MAFHNFERDNKGKLRNYEFHNKSDIVRILGFTIKNSFLYTTDTQDEFNNFAINPCLPIGQYPSDINHRHASYTKLAPEERSGYLQWLADGKSYDSSYYFDTYFLGLEFRVLMEHKNVKDIIIEMLELRPKVNWASRHSQFVWFTLLNTDTSNWSKSEKRFIWNEIQGFTFDPLLCMGIYLKLSISVFNPQLTYDAFQFPRLSNDRVVLHKFLIDSVIKGINSSNHWEQRSFIMIYETSCGSAISGKVNIIEVEFKSLIPNSNIDLLYLTLI